MGRFFDRHPLLLRTLAVAALIWGVGYLTWRIGWSGQGASPVAFAMLLVTEIYGLWALGTLTWFSWSRSVAERPPATPGRKRRRLRLHLRRAGRGGAGDAGRLPRPHLPAHDLAAGRRAAAGDAGAGRAGRGALPDPPRQLPRQGRQHQRGAAAHRGRAGADARRRPRADARRPRRDGRLLRRRADGAGAEPARLLQPRLGPALRGRPPRAVALLPGHLPRQGPPRSRLLVRLGGADPARGAAGDRRRRHRDDRRGLPHDDPAAAPRLGDPLPRRGAGPGAGAARPRRLPAAARPLGARQPRRLHPAGVAAARARAAPAAAPLLLRQPRRLPGAADAAAAAADPGAGAVDRRAADEDQRGGAGGAVAALGVAQPLRRRRRWRAATCGSARPPTTSC